MKNKILILLLIASMFLATNLVSAQDYAPGEIIVGFYGNVTEAEANSLVRSYGIIFESHFPKQLVYYVKVLSGSEEEYISQLNQSDIVQITYGTFYPEYEKKDRYILIMFKKDIKENEAREFISTFENLKINYELNRLNWGVVKVPVGKELEFIQTFKKENIVRYAELNSIITIAGKQQELVKSNYLYYVISIGILFLISIILFFILRKRR